MSLNTTETPRAVWRGNPVQSDHQPDVDQIVALLTEILTLAASSADLSLVTGALSWQGIWDANANSPAIPAAAGGNDAHLYWVGTAGTTEIDGISDWEVGDYLVSDGSEWHRIRIDVGVITIAGKTGAVTLETADISDATAAGRALVTAADAAAQRSALGLASVAASGSSDDLTEGAANLLMTTAERAKLAGIEGSATADQTGAEIKAVYEAEADTNAFTDAEKAKLAGVSEGATKAPHFDRPGDNPAAFSATYTGEGADKAPLTGGTVVTSAGLAYVQTGAGTVAARHPVALNSDVIEFTARFRRTSNPSDPNNHAILLRVAWLDEDKALVGSVVTLATKSDALTSSGLIELSARASALAVSNVTAPPSGAVYACPFVQTYGDDGITAVETLRITEVTDLHVIESADLSQIISDAEAATAAAEAAADLVATETLDAMADVASYDRAAGVGVITLKGGNAAFDGLGGQWVYDSSDTTSASNPPAVLVGNDGARYKPARQRAVTLYVDSVSGNDSNTGLASNAAFQTIAKLMTVLRSGDTVRLMGGSTWREQLGVQYATNLKGIRFERWGGGKRPVISGRDVVTGFTLDSGAVYSVSVTKAHDGAAARCYPTMFEDGQRLTEVLIGDAGVTDLASAIAAVQATPGSFYFAGPGTHTAGWSAGAKTYYVHASDSSNPASNGKAYESATRLYAATGISGEAEGLTFVSGFHHDGMSGLRLKDCVVLDPHRHAVLGQDAHEGTIIAGGNPRYQGALFHNAPPGGSPDLSWTECVAIGHWDADITKWMTQAFYTHTVTTSPAREKHWLIDCEAHNVLTAIILGDVNEVEATNFVARDALVLCASHPRTIIRGLDARCQKYRSSYRVFAVSPSHRLYIEDAYIDYNNRELFYNTSGFGSLTMRDFMVVQNVNGDNLAPTTAIEGVGATAMDALDLSRGYFIANGRGGYLDRFIRANSITSCAIDQVMVAGCNVGTLDWWEGPNINLGGSTAKLSTVNTGRVLMMPAPDRAFARGDSGKMAPKHGAWRPGMNIFSGVCATDYANSPASVVLVGDVIAATVFDQRPENVYTPSSHLNAVRFAEGSDHYVAVGNDGLIVRSASGSATSWSAVTSGTSSHLRGVSCNDKGNNGSGPTNFAPTGVVIAVGDGGLILRSTDYGATWASVTSGTTDRLRAVDTNHNGTWIAVGDSGRLVRSTDDGATWTASTQGSKNMYACLFSLQTQTFLIGGNDGTVYTSTDTTGSAWTLRTTNSLNRVVGFADDDTSNVVTAALYQTSLDPAQILSSADGITWTVQASNLPFQLHAISGPGSRQYNGLSTMAVGESQFVGYRHAGTGDWNLLLCDEERQYKMHDHRHIDDAIGRAMTRRGVVPVAR